MGLGFTLGALGCACLMPCLLVILLITGMSKLAVQSDISKIWVRTSSEFAKRGKYWEEGEGDAGFDGATKGGGSTLLLTIAKPRAGGNVMKAEHLLSMKDRLKKMVDTNVVYKGKTYTYEDVCMMVVDAYQFPCFRYTPLDCFQEGGYDFKAPSQKTVYEAHIKSNTGPGYGNKAGLGDAAVESKKPLNAGGRRLNHWNATKNATLPSSCGHSVPGGSQPDCSINLQKHWEVAVAELSIKPSVPGLIKSLLPRKIIFGIGYMETSRCQGPGQCTVWPHYNPDKSVKFPPWNLCGQSAVKMTKTFQCHTKDASGNAIDTKDLWPETLECQTCLLGLYELTEAGHKTNVGFTPYDFYYFILGQLWEMVRVGDGGDALTNGGMRIADLVVSFTPPGKPPITQNEAWDYALPDLVFKIAVSQAKFAGLTPYTWNEIDPTTGKAYGGVVRKALKSMDKFGKVTYLSEAEVLQEVSTRCCLFDGCQQLPALNKYLTFGGESPKLITGIDGSNVAKTFDKVQAVQNVILFKGAQGVMDRLNSSAAINYRPGGPVVVTLKEAEAILQEFKQKYEEVYSDGWQTNDGPIEFTAWSDDAGADGSTARMLNNVTTKAFEQAAMFFVAITLMSVLFFIDLFDPLVQSRCVLVFVGALMVILGMWAAIGITFLMGMKIGVATSYTMPFILVGILCDDMYMLSLSLDLIKRATTPEERWINAMRSVGLPITVTSAVNFGVFFVMFIVSDLPAITDIGVTGMVATLTLYFTLMISFSMLVYFDLLRRSANRFECLCCLKRKGPAPEKPSQTGSGSPASGGLKRRVSGIFKEKEKLSIMFERVYQPMLRSMPVRVLFLSFSAGVFIFAASGLSRMEVGLDLQDLFQDGEQPRQFITQRMKYFPVWPTNIKWGAIDYKDPMTQMEMVKQFEGVSATSRIVPNVRSQIVWTASYAEFCMGDFSTFFKTGGKVDSVFATKVNDCGLPRHLTQVNGVVVKPHGAIWVANTLGLKLQNATGGSGYCYIGNTPNFKGFGKSRQAKAYHVRGCKNETAALSEFLANGKVSASTCKDSEKICYTQGCCPAVIGQSDKEMGECLSHWAKYTAGYDLCAPSLPGMCGGKNSGENKDCKIFQKSKDDGGRRRVGSYVFKMPIKISNAGDNDMFAYKLFKTTDYLTLFKETRDIVDDNKLNMVSWMSGIAFDYWEQYLTLKGFLLKIGGIVIAAGFLMSFLFLLAELTLNGFGTLGPRILNAFVGAFLIALVMLASMVTVLGLACWCDIQLSAFTAISVLLASGFAIEYAVHVVHHFLEAQDDSAVERSVHTMAFLFVPTAMSFFSSTVSVIFLAFSGFTFVTRFFFYPLLFVVCITYFYGAVTLPFVLSLFTCLPKLRNDESQFAQYARDAPVVPPPQDVEQPKQEKPEERKIVSPKESNDNENEQAPLAPTEKPARTSI